MTVVLSFRPLFAKAIALDEAVRVMISNVKIASAGRAIAAMARNEKASKKAATKEGKGRPS